MIKSEVVCFNNIIRIGGEFLQDVINLIVLIALVILLSHSPLSPPPLLPPPHHYHHRCRLHDRYYVL